MKKSCLQELIELTILAILAAFTGWAFYEAYGWPGIIPTALVAPLMGIGMATFGKYLLEKRRRKK